MEEQLWYMVRNLFSVQYNIRIKHIEMGMKGFVIFVIFLLFAFNGSAAFSEDSGASTISQSNIADSGGKSFKADLIKRSRISDRNLDMKTGNQAVTTGKKAESPASNINLLDDGAYSILTLYPGELKSSRLLDSDSELVKRKSDLDSRSDSHNSKTKIYFGALPFVSVPRPNEEEEQDPGFISSDSISVFWYFKREF
ncbi:MAG TPA: hypothetical protein VHT73_09465 [Thermodesulfobacteriota bacterium]|nr:hypothetical protein [Thermodesulfobacteriota bacterium]